MNDKNSNLNKDPMADMYSYLIKDSLHNELDYIIRNQNVEVLKEIFSSPTYSVLPRNELESSVFRAAYFSPQKTYETEFMKYLVFEYKISEENSINTINGEIEPVVKNMFQARRLQAELSFELINNSENNKNKKTKV